MLARFHAQSKDAEGAQRHLAACYAILDSFHRERRPMDPQMRQIHAQLAGMLGRGGADRGEGG